MRTGAFSISDAGHEDGDEPLERVLVHRVYSGEIGDAEEQDLSVLSDGDVQRTRLVYLSLCRLRYRYFHLQP